VDWGLLAFDPTGFKRFEFSNPSLLSMHTRLSLFFSMLTPQFAVMAPISYSMARFRMLFANIHNYAGSSDSLGIIVLPAKRSVSSIL
jgi:hypothetical protein